MVKNIFYIPEKTQYVVVADLFVEDYVGGAELTLEAILEGCPEQYIKIHSSSLTPDLIKKYNNKHWILGNFSGVSQESLIELVLSKVKYTIIECDYKYCSYRSSHLHKLQTGHECDCHKQKIGKFIRTFFQKANKVFFMSEGQMNEYIKLFPQFNNDNFLLQTSTFEQKTLDHLKQLRELRNANGHNNKFAILKGGSWIKAEKETVDWALQNQIQFDLIGGFKPEQFLSELSKYRGLVFKPAGFDTAPRLVIEAKLLGLELILNDNVQHKDEAWFTSDIENCEKYLKTRVEYFWSNL